MDFFQFFSGFEGSAGYVIVLATLILCGLGVPVPEDVILISGGYIAFESQHSVWPMAITGLVGIMAGDSIIYGFGRRFGLQLAGHRFLQRYVTEERLARVDGMFKKHGEKILLAARFMPGVRAVTFFSAGAMGVPYWKFFAFDGIAALVSAPLWVILGYRFGHDVVDWAKQFQWVLLAVGALGIAAFVAYRLASRHALTAKAGDAEAGALRRRPSPAIVALVTVLVLGGVGAAVALRRQGGAPADTATVGATVTADPADAALPTVNPLPASAPGGAHP